MRLRSRGGRDFCLGSELGEDKADAADDVVGWGFVSGKGEKLDGEVAGVGAKDETTFVEVDEAQEESGAPADGVERGLVGAIRSERVVVTVENGDGSGRDEWVHGGGLLGVCADGEEALPMGVRGGGADAIGVIAVETGGGDLDCFDDGGGGNPGFIHGGRGRDDGNDLDWIAGLGGDGRLCGRQVDGEDLVDGEILGGEDAVETVEREGAFPVEEIRNMRLGQPGRLTHLEERVERHEQSVQRMKGLVGAAGSLLTVFHFAIDYFRR